MALDIKETPSLEYLLAKDGAYARAIVFNFNQVRLMFGQNNYPDLVLCIDGRHCKWVTRLHEAHDFYHPSANFQCDECKKGFLAPVTKDVIVVCPDCGNLPTLINDLTGDKKRKIEALLKDV